MDANEELYGLMVIAREQQAAVSAAIEALEAERKEAAAQRSALSRQASELAKVADDASAALQKAASGAVRQAVVESIKATALALCGSFNATSQPVMARLAGLTEAASDTETRLRALLGWLSVRWMLAVAAGAASLVVAGWFVGMESVEWQRGEIKQLADERDALRTEVANLHVQANALVKSGGGAQLKRCGDARRLCARVEKKTPYGQNGDFFVLSGY